MYVLDSKLQDGHEKLPKWNPRSQDGMFLGNSSVNANPVALELNPKTDHVSYQFHCVFDYHFTTVLHMRNGTLPSNWADLVEPSSEEILPERLPVRNTWLTQ